MPDAREGARHRPARRGLPARRPAQTSPSVRGPSPPDRPLRCEREPAGTLLLVRSVRAPRSGPLLASLARDLRAASSSAHGCSGDLRCGPTHVASLVGRASAEARLRTQLGCFPLHVTNPKSHLRGGHVASLMAVWSWTGGLSESGANTAHERSEVGPTRRLHPARNAQAFRNRAGPEARLRGGPAIERSEMVGPQRRSPQGTVRSGGRHAEVPCERSEHGAGACRPDGADHVKPPAPSQPPCANIQRQPQLVTLKRNATALARRRASAEARPTSEAKWVGPQRRSPQGTSAEEDTARSGRPSRQARTAAQRRARTERTKKYSQLAAINLPSWVKKARAVGGAVRVTRAPGWAVPVAGTRTARGPAAVCT